MAEIELEPPASPGDPGDGAPTRAQRPRSRDELELEIESLAYGGRGVARRDGYVVFVSGALPGDRVRAAITRSKRHFAEARTVELLSPSPDRVPDRCDHGGEPCPGAPWQGLAYERQLAHKQGQVDDALRRIGGLDGFELAPILPAAERWRYRNKLEYSFGLAGDRGDAEASGGELVLGFHARGRWDRIVDARDCLLASERNNARRNELRDWARATALAPYDRRSQHGVLRNLVIREGRRTGQLQSRLVTSAAEIPRPPVDLHTIVEDPRASGTDGPTGALGAEYLEEELCGLRFRISHRAFFQTNTEMAESLYELALEMAGLGGSERVYDLFCGIGTLSLVLARRAGEVWGIELVDDAITDAERNAELNGVGNARFRAGDVRTGIRPLLEETGRPDVVVVDPPRAGLSKKVVRRLIECEARRIVYVSCNPTTLAPNAAQLGEAGYRLRLLQPVDMFPQTPHIECVALLERPRVARGSAPEPGTPGREAEDVPEGAP
ncbi:MAG: 23S rRNA (uracil(1939)-C(5))-methyltransferase RlmD [Actinobacteria bacterium]|nr:23S rRNA (uracil(1939)-C(5))-methyltransferase RlmD [Actinomycetota bacterium]